jgi:hypothetical protein
VRSNSSRYILGKAGSGIGQKQMFKEAGACKKFCVTAAIKDAVEGELQGHRHQQIAFPQELRTIARSVLILVNLPVCGAWHPGTFA